MTDGLRALLIDCPSVSPNELNLGLASMAAVLRHRGHEVRVLDLNSLRVPGSAQRRLREALAWRPRLVGVSVFPACTEVYAHARRILSAARTELGAEALRVVGGVGISIAPVEASRRFAGLADLTVYGEGEATLAEIADRLAGGGSLADVPGTVRMDGDAVAVAPERPFLKDLDSLPFPAYDAFDSIGETMAEYPIMTSRGCPFHCVFCLNQVLTKRTFRYRSARNVVDEICAGVERYRPQAVYIWDDHFSLIRERAEEVCRLLIRERPGLTYYLPDGIRADSVTPDFARLLRESGCAGVSIGFEDPNPDTFAGVKKGEKYEAIVNAIRLLTSAGVPVRASLVIGLPGTTYASTCKAMEAFAKLGIHGEWYLATPFPGTEFHDWVLKNGRVLEDPLSLRALTFRRAVFETPDFSRSERYRAFYRAFAYYSFPERAFYGKVCNPLTQQRYRFEKYVASVFTVARYVPGRLPSHLLSLARDMAGAVFRRVMRLVRR
jgi:radical SAM superfamily enzyme YgiQ (UPF0313 family)